MNTKRQTIWLVSMLSLMVVLSAYYLFTEDTTVPNTATGTQTEEMIKGEANKVIDDAQIQYKEVTGSGAIVDPSDKTQQDSTTAGAVEGTSSISPQDQKILDEMESKGVMLHSNIDEMKMENNMEYQQDLEKLMATMTDTNVTSEQMHKAYEEATALDEREMKITSLEEELQSVYGSAVIDRDNDSYKVIVQSDKLEVKEAVDILSKLMKELNVTQDKVSVQYVSN